MIDKKQCKVARYLSILDKNKSWNLEYSKVKEFYSLVAR